MNYKNKNLEELGKKIDNLPSNTDYRVSESISLPSGYSMNINGRSYTGAFAIELPYTTDGIKITSQKYDLNGNLSYSIKGKVLAESNLTY